MNGYIPDVTVVIPVCNRPLLLVRAIRSCLVQTCAVELVVVDDGSTEDVRGTLESHFTRELAAGTPPCVRLLRQANQGACVARNTGLAAAAGDFVKFLDSDDELLPGVLAEEVRAARKSGCDALLTGWEEKTWREDGTEDLAKRRTRAAPSLANGIDDMLLGKAPCASSALYRTEFIRPLRWDPTWTKAQDWGWALTVCLAGARFQTLDRPSCAYNHHGGERITNRGDAFLRSTQARQALLGMVERALRSRSALTDDRRLRLAQYFYRDCQVLAQHDPAGWKEVWAHCLDLVPGFRPAEPNRIVGLLTRTLGVRRGVSAYVRLKQFAQHLGLLPTRNPGRPMHAPGPATADRD
jgi:glycosyltransferase involved in cell wall biosynthesis